MEKTKVGKLAENFEGHKERHMLMFATSIQALITGHIELYNLDLEEHIIPTLRLIADDYEIEMAKQADE